MALQFDDAMASGDLGKATDFLEAMRALQSDDGLDDETQGKSTAYWHILTLVVVHTQASSDGLRDCRYGQSVVRFAEGGRDAAAWSDFDLLLY